MGSINLSTKILGVRSEIWTCLFVINVMYLEFNLFAINLNAKNLGERAAQMLRHSNLCELKLADKLLSPILFPIFLMFH